MKKLMYVISIAIIFSACQKYEFPGEEDSKVLDTEIQVKNSDGIFETTDTARITAGIQLILKAVTINGNPTQWYWDFGDGTNDNGQQVDHMYQEPGTYDVSVTAIDGGNSNESEIVIIAETSSQAVFTLHSADAPNNQGEIRYVVSGAKEYIPDPPVPENGPFGYQGSDPVSDWDVIEISPDTSVNRIYWEIITQNTVHSQAFGGFDSNSNFVWADMDQSMYFSEDYGHLRVGFLDGQIVQEDNFENQILGSSGDTGNNPEVRFEINEEQEEIDIYVNVVNYSEEIDSPKARFKVNKEDAWSDQLDTDWVGGSGYVKYTTSINDAAKYRLRIEPDQNNPGQYTNMNGSEFHITGEECIGFQFFPVEEGQKKATTNQFVVIE